MMHVKLTRSFKLTVHGESSGDEAAEAEALDLHSDEVMNELLALEADDLHDSDVSISLVKKEIEISVVAGADDYDEAMLKADSAIRAAIHAAGGHTPEWKALEFSPTSTVADLVDA